MRNVAFSFLNRPSCDLCTARVVFRSRWVRRFRRMQDMSKLSLLGELVWLKRAFDVTVKCQVGGRMPLSVWICDS